MRGLSLCFNPATNSLLSLLMSCFGSQTARVLPRVEVIALTNDTASNPFDTFKWVDKYNYRSLWFCFLVMHEFCHVSGSLLSKSK